MTLEALSMLDDPDLKSMDYNDGRYQLHTLYRVMNVAFDVCSGDPQPPPAKPGKGRLSKTYAKERCS